jgi:copper ion binding protein
MTCAACVRRVEEGLRAMPGVRAAAVNFATEKAQVEYDGTQTDIPALQNKVRDLGYESFADASAAGRRKTTISVGGMTCAACVRRVENALAEVDGVVEATSIWYRPRDRNPRGSLGRRFRAGCRRCRPGLRLSGRDHRGGRRSD